MHEPPEEELGRLKEENAKLRQEADAWRAKAKGEADQRKRLQHRLTDRKSLIHRLAMFLLTCRRRMPHFDEMSGLDDLLKEAFEATQIQEPIGLRERLSLEFDQKNLSDHEISEMRDKARAAVMATIDFPKPKQDQPSDNAHYEAFLDLMTEAQEICTAAGTTYNDVCNENPEFIRKIHGEPDDAQR
jgi:hypothetical protein